MVKLPEVTKKLPPKLPEQPSDSTELLLVWHFLRPVQPDVHVHVAGLVPEPVERGPKYKYAAVKLRSDFYTRVSIL